jgi:hypothetical protein
MKVQTEGFRIELLEVNRGEGWVYVSVSSMPGRRSEGNRTMNLAYIEEGMGWQLPDGFLHPVIVLALPFDLPDRAWM